jgi:hypothetical protein
MTAPTTYAGTALIIQVATDTSPETFAEPCGLTTKNFDEKSTANTNIIPDCADPEALAWESTDISSRAVEISAQGILAQEALATWNSFKADPNGRTCKIYLGATLYATGTFKVTDFKLSGQRGQKVNVDLTIKSDGEVIYA